MSKQEVVICRDIRVDLEQAIAKHSYDKLFILTDEHTRQFCLPLIEHLSCVEDAVHLCIGVEDVNKNIETLTCVWKQLSDQGATRHSLLINLGGGMVTDLGGFAAATFKRGIAYLNIPTTLLSMVDAAVGGKTGINFNGLKNEIGAFAPASSVLIDCNFLKSLDFHNILSGYAEMLKHGLISNAEHWSELLAFDMEHIDYVRLQQLVGKSVEVKEKVVKQDPLEKGLRKALNFGHTVGHAFESWALKKGNPVLHGYAVAWGMVCELYLSCIKTGFPQDKLRSTLQFIKDNYGRLPFTCKDYECLHELMKHDKKNAAAGVVNFTLLGEIGNVCLDQTATQNEIFDLLDFYSEVMG